MKSLRIFAAALAISACLAGTVSAAEKWDMALIGKMTLPKNVTVEAGEQQAIPFAAAKSPKWFFTKKGITGGHFYTMAAKDGPDYTYGWAFSAPIGAQYMLEAGIGSYKGKTPAEQMDLIAAHLNQKLAAEAAEFSGTAPLVKIADKKNPRWEGDFVLVTKEKDITYREAYRLTLQMSGFRCVIGILASDAEAADFTDSLGKMFDKRSFYSEKELLKRFTQK